MAVKHGAQPCDGLPHRVLALVLRSCVPEPLRGRGEVRIVHHAQRQPQRGDSGPVGGESAASSSPRRCHSSITLTDGASAATVVSQLPPRMRQADQNSIAAIPPPRHRVIRLSHVSLYPCQSRFLPSGL